MRALLTNSGVNLTCSDKNYDSGATREWRPSCLLVLAAEEDVEYDEQEGNASDRPDTTVEGGVVREDVRRLQTEEE